MSNYGTILESEAVLLAKHKLQMTLLVHVPF
uniref:Uncharacterized protein n=1 Tax=Rhizophora mucronata TaxID=61149 RepID=A0A2P2QXL5_RHIMU